MATNPKPTPAKAGSTVKGLRVRSCSPQGPFRRAGYTFGRDPIEIPLQELKDDQVKRLKCEPMLVVEEVEIKLPGEPEPAET